MRSGSPTSTTGRPRPRRRARGGRSTRSSALRLRTLPAPTAVTRAYPVRRCECSLLTRTSRGRDCSYTEFCNFLDLTACVFPVTKVDKALDVRAPPHAFHNHEDEAVYKLCMSPSTTLWPLGLLTAPCADDPELWHGMPVSLQLIGRTQEEEGVIAMTEVVDGALKTFKQAAGA